MTPRNGADFNFWALMVMVVLFLVWALTQLTGCAAFKPASSAGPAVKLYALVPTPQTALAPASWELRRYEAGVGAQTLSLDAAKGFSCVSAPDLELMLKAILGI